MLYYLHELTELLSPLRIFRYVTFRALGGAATAFALAMVFGPPLIRRLRRLKLAQAARLEDVPELQRAKWRKSDTPIGGGLLILGATAVATLLWAVPESFQVRLALGTMVFMGLIGAIDDGLKLSRRNPRGLSARRKLALQALWAVGLTAYLWADPDTRGLVNALMLPFVKQPVIPALGLAGALLFATLVLVGATNAVNLTDGLDGLAIGCTSAVAGAYLVMAYATGHAVFAAYLQIPFVPGSEELAVFCGCLLGAGLGFLWYNCHPAQVFMGDTGSLALGGAIASVAILVQQEIALVFVGGVFVMEAVSVLLQVGWFKLTGRRLFRCAPIHHHFELVEKARAAREGRDIEVVETMVTIRFWILGLICALLGVATLKIR